MITKESIIEVVKEIRKKEEMDRKHNISIPSNVRYNKKLSASAKIFYGEIQYEIL